MTPPTRGRGRATPLDAARGPARDVLCIDAVAGCRLIEPDSVDMIFTDPPYNRDSLPLYETVAICAARVLMPGKFLLAMSGGLYQDEIMAAMSRHLTYYWTFHVYLSGSATGEVHPGGNHKPIITRVKPIHAFVKGWGEPRTVIYDPFSGDGNDKRFHHWGQDAKSARYYIDCFTNEGDLVLDPFCGGGTTPLVCQALKRQYIAFDSDPEAIETTRARLRNPLFAPEANGQLRMEFVK